MKNIVQFIGTLGAAVGFGLLSSSASAVVIFEDNFNRANSYNVGHGWHEIEDDSDDVRIKNNAMRLRDNRSWGVDAAATQINLDATGLSDIYLDFDWAADYDTENKSQSYTDWLYAGVKIDGSDWQTIWSTDLGGSRFTSVSVGAILDAANASSFKLSFWTDVTASNEYALIDNVRLHGTAHGSNGRPAASVTEPGTLALLGIGLFSIGLARRKKV